MGSDDVLRALRTGDRARAVRNHCRDHRGLAAAADLDRLQPAGHRCVQSARSQGLPDRVRHDHDAAHRHGVQAFHRAGGLAPRQHHPGQDGDPDRADRPGAQVRDPRPGDQPRQDRGARRRDAGPRGDLLAAARAL